MAFIAGHIVNYSIIFLALQWFNSHALAGLGYGLCFGPPLILGWFAGVFCDRYSPRKVLLIAQNSFFISIALLYLATQSPMENRQTLLLFAALFSGVGWSFVAPARFATLPYYVNAKKLAAAAIALNLMVMTGFGLAPLIIKQVQITFNWQTVLITAATLFAISSAILLPLRFAFTPKAPEKAILEIKNSFHFIKQTPIIKHLLLLSTIVYLMMGPMQVIFPTIAKEALLLSEVAQGYYLSLIAVGLILGGILAMVLKNQGRVGKILLITITSAGIGISLVGTQENLIISIVLLSVTAMSGGIAVSFIVAGLQSFSASQYRGRIMSFYSIISQVIPALSGITVGLIAQITSPETSLQIIAGIIIIATFACSVQLKSIRQLRSFTNE